MSPSLRLLVCCAVLGLSHAAAYASRTDRLKDAHTWAYQLQKVDADRLLQTNADLLVIDAFDDELRPRTRAFVERLKAGRGHARVVLAYISIGEAESYRPYWEAGWKTHRPDWIGPMNPAWRENYPVKYWRREWQQVLLGRGGYFDQLLAQGFDGAYLDRLDVYERWGPTGRGQRNQPESARAMVALVQSIAHHTRKVRGRADFLLVGQNAPGLAASADYLREVDAIALEDLLYWGGRRRSRRYRRAILQLLQPARAKGLPVFAVDYIHSRKKRRRYAALARRFDLIPYAAPSRGLDRIDVPRTKTGAASR